MTSTSATHDKDATPQRREVATMDDLWRESDLVGVPAGALLSAAHQLLGRDAQLPR